MLGKVRLETDDPHPLIPQPLRERKRLQVITFTILVLNVRKISNEVFCLIAKNELNATSRTENHGSQLPHLLELVITK